LTASFKTIGSLFVPLPVVIAGVSLYTSYMQARSQAAEAANSAKLQWHVALFIVFIRFVIWPVASIAIIYGFAKNHGFLGDDPMLWFTMMLMPTGPSAMKLITMVAVSNASEEDEHIIAKLLTVSFSRLMTSSRLTGIALVHYLTHSCIHCCRELEGEPITYIKLEI
jgi:nitrate reductase NapE component